LEEVELLCDRIAIMSEGKIAGVGTKKEFTRNGKKLEEKYFELTGRNKKKGRKK
jgi:ABC-type multidrug transport system ATPase subunit